VLIHRGPDINTLILIKCHKLPSKRSLSNQALTKSKASFS